MTKEWEMILELLEGHEEGDFELFDNHLLFLKNPDPREGQEPGLFDLLDEHVPAEEQLPEWKIKTLYWLYEWHLNDNFIPYDEFNVEDYDDAI